MEIFTADTSADIRPESLAGLFSLEIVDDKPFALYIDDDFCERLGLERSHSPQELYNDWFQRVRAEDRQAIHMSLQNLAAGIKSTTKFNWKHPLVGWVQATCSGIYNVDEDGRVFVRGYFKANSNADDVPESSEVQLLKTMLTEAMMDAFTVCGLTDLANNKIVLLKDKFNIGGVLGNNFGFDTWRDTVSALVAREDSEKFNDASTRKALLHYFNVSDDEMQIEFRCLEPKTRQFRWMKLRFVRFKGDFVSKYKEFFVFRDITDHNQTEFNDELRVKLINGLTLPYEDIDLVNLKTGKVFTSGQHGSRYAESFRMTGYYDDEIRRYTYLCDCSDEQRAEIMDKFSVRRMRERFAAGEKIIETEVRRMNMTTRAYEWVRVQGFLSSVDEDGAPHLAMVTVQAINEEKERQLKDKHTLEFALRAERQYKQAILSASIAVYTYNVTTDTLYDEVIEKDGIAPLIPMLGMSCPCSYNEYINKKAEYITTKQEADFFRKAFNTVTMLDMFNSNRYAFDNEYEFMLGGKKGIFRESVILTKDLETNEVWGLTYVKNVTQESENNKHIEQALRDAFFQAQRANSAKTLFMSQMSHDIRTPLNSILGMAAIAQEHSDDRARVLDCMDKIEYSGRHLLELINNVLDLSAIESGKTTLACDDFDMEQFIHDTLAVVKPLADRKGHTLIADIKDMRTMVNGDRLKLRQLLTNVLSNAVKYTPDGGEIHFTAAEIEPDRHDVARYMFTVEDNGIGMSPEVADRVFDPFMRADSNRVTKVEGTGLGMSIALNIARMMNGDINVRSVPNKGSVFEVTVCLRRGETPVGDILSDISMDEPKKVRMSDYDFSGRRVLLAEDLEFNAEIASEFLSEAGIITEVAENGAIAVEMFNKSPVGYYSMIFMDIQMPELNGHDAARKIRSLPREDAQTIPIVAMTANAFVEDVRMAKEAGMNGHIAKPLEIARLCAELNKWMK